MRAEDWSGAAAAYAAARNFAISVSGWMRAANGLANSFMKLGQRETAPEKRRAYFEQALGMWQASADKAAGCEIEDHMELINEAFMGIITASYALGDIAFAEKQYHHWCHQLLESIGACQRHQDFEDELRMTVCLNAVQSHMGRIYVKVRPSQAFNILHIVNDKREMKGLEPVAADLMDEADIIFSIAGRTEDAFYKRQQLECAVSAYRKALKAYGAAAGREFAEERLREAEKQLKAMK